MYSCSLRDKICPRTIRATPLQLNIVMMTMSTYICWSALSSHESITEEAMSNMGSVGIQLNISTIRMMI